MADRDRWRDEDSYRDRDDDRFEGNYGRGGESGRHWRDERGAGGERWGREREFGNRDYGRDYGRGSYGGPAQPGWRGDYGRGESYGRGDYQRGEYGRGGYGPGYSRADQWRSSQGSYGSGEYSHSGFVGRGGDWRGDYYDRDFGPDYGRRTGSSRYGRGNDRGYGSPGQPSGDYDRERRDIGERSFGHSGSYGRGEERGFWDRASDEVSSWFGDEEAARRRQEDQHRGRGPRNYTRSDDRIREDVSDRLTDDPMVDASDIEVGIAKGEVTLSGTVDSREARRRAEDIAEQVSGVTHVQNDLRVKRDRGRATWTDNTSGAESMMGASTASHGPGMTGSASGSTSTGTAGTSSGGASPAKRSTGTHG